MLTLASTSRVAAAASSLRPVLARSISVLPLQHTYGNYIDGEYTTPAATYPNYTPRNGDVLCQVPATTAAEVDAAVKSSKAAFPAWSAMSMAERGRILTKTAHLMRKHNAELSMMESMDAGSVIAETTDAHIAGAADAFEYYGAIAATSASMGEFYGGASQNVDPAAATGKTVNTFSYTAREPIGVCVGIGAWNYPALVGSWKIAPALACGNTMVYKPSEFSPMTSLKIAEILTEAGAPPGVLNVVIGAPDRSTGPALTEHPDVKKISFTGSTAVGQIIVKKAAESLKKVTMELGGKSPLIVFADADIENAVGAAMNGNWYTQGAVCSNCTRVFLHKDIKEKFMKRLVERTKQIKIGDPSDESSQMGALIMPPDNKSGHFDRVMGFIERAKADPRNTLVYGGEAVTEGVPEGGYYVQPTIFECSDDKSEIATDEVFGAVMSVLTFDDESDVIRRANDSPFGLGAGLMTKDLATAHRVAGQLQSGNVWVNDYNLTPSEMPFGGYNMSGYGRELSVHSVDSYTQIKHVYINLGDVDSSLYPM